MDSTPEDFRELIATEVRQWRTSVDAMNLKLD